MNKTKNHINNLKTQASLEVYRHQKIKEIKSNLEKLHAPVKNGKKKFHNKVGSLFENTNKISPNISTDISVTANRSITAHKSDLKFFCKCGSSAVNLFCRRCLVFECVTCLKKKNDHITHPSIDFPSNNVRNSRSFYDSIIKHEIQSYLKFVKQFKNSPNEVDVSNNVSNHQEKLNDIINLQNDLINLFSNENEEEEIEEVEETLESHLKQVENLPKGIDSDSENIFSNSNRNSDSRGNNIYNLSDVAKNIDVYLRIMKEFKLRKKIKKEVDQIMLKLEEEIAGSFKQISKLYSKYSVFSSKKIKTKKDKNSKPKFHISNKHESKLIIMSSKSEKKYSIAHQTGLHVLNNVRYSKLPLFKKSRSSVSLVPATLFNDSITLQEFRKGIIGRNTLYKSPFGEFIALYADDTASGRPHKVVEDYIKSILPLYANTHSENSHYAVTFNALYHGAQKYLHEFYNAPANYVVIGTGNGVSGAIHHWQETLNKRYPGIVTDNIAEQKKREIEGTSVPIVFVTEYEHHSNIISWLNWGCEVQPISHTAEGNWDEGLIDLEHKLNQYKNRPLIIVSTTAASNITSQKTPIIRISNIVKSFKLDNPELRNKVLWSLDIAAYASHNKLDISYLEMDAVFISVHKLTGGPGSSGILILNGNHYAGNVPPTRPAGGTVDLVYGYKPSNIVFTQDISARETAGTPGILQFIRAALTFQLQDSLGYNLIKQREHELTAKVFECIKNMNLQWEKNGLKTRIKILGPSNYRERLSVLAVIMIDKSGKEIPFKLSHRLLSDLFGIQTRSGCNCAGPFGVELLNIDKQYIESKAEEIRKGNFELKNVYGWLRFNIHFSFTDEDLNYLLNALGFIAENAFTFRDKLYEMKNLNWDLKGNSGLLELDFNCSLGNIEKTTNLDVRKPFTVKEVHESQRNYYLLRNFEIAERVLKQITK